MDGGIHILDGVLAMGMTAIWLCMLIVFYIFGNLLRNMTDMIQ